MKKLILLVEDEAVLAEQYKQILEAKNFKVEIVDWASKAIERLKKDPLPNAVILDLVLPDSNGIYVLQEIRKNSKTKDLPVIVLTNFSDERLENMSRELGAQYYIKVHLFPEDLVKIVKKTISLKKKYPKKD